MILFLLTLYELFILLYFHKYDYYLFFSLIHSNLLLLFFSIYLHEMSNSITKHYIKFYNYVNYQLILHYFSF